MKKIFARVKDHGKPHVTDIYVNPKEVKSWMVPVVLKSLTKTLTPDEADVQGYTYPTSHLSISDFVSVSTDEVVLKAGKYVLKAGFTQEDVQKSAEHAWKNCINFSSEQFYVRVD